jgi:hypothetical protein
LTVASRGTVFQPFLDQSLQRPARGRAYVVSLALHGLVAVLIWLAWGQGDPEGAPGSVPVRVAASLHLPNLHRPALVGPEAPERAGPSAKVGASSPPRRPQARPAVVVSLVPSPEPAPSAPPGTEDEPEGQRDAPDPAVDYGGTQAGGPGGTEGLAGEPGQADGRPGRRRPIQLFGRVVGGGRREVRSPQGVPYAPLKESTDLRTYDVFPPLPASQWTSDRPYVVVLDVCVSGDGQVSDVALVKPASRIFDPVVLDAVRTWRYKPRLVDGEARAFCHVVAIKYEQL